VERTAISATPSPARWSIDPSGRYGLAAIAIFSVLHPEVAALAERTWGRPIDDLVERFGAAQRYTLDLADEARTLAALVP
jgi:hypothetical protein